MGTPDDKGPDWFDWIAEVAKALGLFVLVLALFAFMLVALWVLG